MKRSSRELLFLIAALLIAAAPFAFALLRLVTTGTDWRYLWVAAGAFAGSGMVIGIGVQRSRAATVTIGVAALGLFVGTLWAGAEATIIGNARGVSPWIVSFAFSFCETVGAVLYFMSRPRAS